MEFLQPVGLLADSGLQRRRGLQVPKGKSTLLLIWIRVMGAVLAIVFG
jgi:hypothetical protein